MLRPELIQTLEHLTARWARADTPLLRHAFPQMAEGPVSVPRLAEVAGTTADATGRALDSGRIELDRNGDIVEVFGVTLGKTLHRIGLEHTVLYSCCALVAHVVPRLLNRSIEVHSEDPVTSERVQLQIAPEGLRGVHPDTAMASMVVTDERTIHEDAPVYFCQHVHHFGSRKTAEEFIAGDAGRYIVTIAELDAVARRVHSAIWS